jgi:hydrogenase maturation protein HypF
MTLPATSETRARAFAAARGNVRERLIVDGIVQGVGFRPFVWRLAHALGLDGFARNRADGIEIEVEGRPALVAELRRRLAECPAPAAVRRVRGARIAPRGSRGFAILASADGCAYTDLPPDLAVCADCRREVADPRDRRFRYPFTNCARCGPRFTVAESVPYDRAATTLRGFAPCADCAREYGDPSDRRFHAEPIACPRCGPRAWLERCPVGGAAAAEAPGDALAQAAEILCRGGVVAVLGLGGFHLVCDAANAGAVARVRAIKRRPLKPLAVMVAAPADAERLAELTPAERVLLVSPAAPIVLLRQRRGAALAANLAPGLDRIGVMLPYTPLHHVLVGDAGRPLVMTSANRPGEPIAVTADEARDLLAGAVDALLLHDRPIHQRCDDGVWMATRGGAQPLRRSRGSAPARIAMPVRPDGTVLGVGGDFKNAFCLLDRRGAVLSQYIGALDCAPTQAHFRDSLAKLERLTGMRAAIAACDLHPGYASRRLAEGLGLPCVGVQHHHAHVAACLAEHGRRGPAIGVAFDGTGYGADGAIWGGEVLVADLAAFNRVGHFEYLPLPGGDAAIRHPARIAAAYLLALFGDVPDADLCAALGAPAIALLRAMIARRLHTVDTSSCGRLFDAVAALLGIADQVAYEGQAAMQLEALARSMPGAASTGSVVGYPFDDDAGVVRLRPLFAAILADRDRGVPAPIIARRFHRTVAAVAGAQARRARALSGLGSVALSGGCFQNQLLLGDCLTVLAADGFEVLVHRQVPANDGGLALGQAVVAAARLEGGGTCA